MQKRSTSFSIIFKIWIAAMLLNTVFGTAVMTNMFTADADTIGLVALMGLVYGVLFTIPLVIILFMFMSLFVGMHIEGIKLFGLVFATGQFLTVAFLTLFFIIVGTYVLPVWSILFVAVGSGSVAILLEYRPIIHLRKNKDDDQINGLLG